MDRIYGDIDIPGRAEPEEQSVPYDLRIFFEYERAEKRLCLTITAGELCFSYKGGGLVSGRGGYFKLSPLKILDPFLSRRAYINGKYMKIFLRVLLPKLSRDGLKAGCGLALDDGPAVRVNIKRVEYGAVRFDVAWRADPASLEEIPDFSGCVESRGVIYQGSLSVLNALPRADGSFELSGEEAAALGVLAEAAPGLFFGDDVPSLKLLGRRASPRPEPARKETAQAREQTARSREQTARNREQTARSREPSEKSAEAGAEIIGFEGPVMIAASIKPYPPAGGERLEKFVGEAKRLSEYRGREAPYRPFTAYWPTYDSMSRDRREWYFFWRGEFFSGNVLKTDLSYIFVALYECINLACGDARKSLSRMLALWKAYRGEFALLDRYVPGWIFDFILLNRLDIKPEDAFSGMELPGGVFMPVPEVFFENTLKNGLGALPLEVLELFCAYDPKKSKFFERHGQTMREGVARALNSLDTIIKKVKGKTLLECFEPEPKKYIYIGYRGAVCGEAVSRRIELNYRPYSRSVALRSFLGDVLRHTENLLRKSVRYPGRLRCGTLRPEIAAAIERALITAAREAEKAPAEPVRIDIEKALALEADSWENTKKLIEAAGTGEEEDFSAQPVKKPARPENTQPEPDPGPEDGPAPEDESPWSLLALSLTSLEKRMLALLLSGGSPSEAASLAGEEYTFPEAVYESINTKFSDIFCDVLIDLTPEPELAQDYRDDIRGLL